MIDVCFLVFSFERSRRAVGASRGRYAQASKLLYKARAGIHAVLNLLTHLGRVFQQPCTCYCRQIFGE